MVGSLAMLWGYFSSALRRADRYEDREFRRFLRGYQYACLGLGKRRATRRYDEAQEAVWQARTAKDQSVVRARSSKRLLNN